MKITQSNEFIKEFIQSLTRVVDPKKKNPYRIKICGHFVKVASGKTVWPSKGAAKNALRNHFCSNSNLESKIKQEVEKACILKGGMSFYDKNRAKNEAWSNFVEQLENEGVLEFVEVSS